jgi:sporulation protein YlmC with PRC-barrel domain
MEIPLNAQVECTDGICGNSVYVLVNPISEQITHLVVKAPSLNQTEYMVPLENVTGTIVGTIQLNCSKAELEKMPPFVKTEFVDEKVPVYAALNGFHGYGVEGYYYWPYISPEGNVQVPVEHRQVPPGEMVVHRGARIMATDGYVGRVDEFMVNPENGHITHLVMREGHLWGQKDVIIPLSAMGEAQDDAVFLKLDKRQIESLPTFPVRRRW